MNEIRLLGLHNITEIRPIESGSATYTLPSSNGSLVTIEEVASMGGTQPTSSYLSKETKTASGTYFEFLSIPSATNKIYIIIDGLSMSGTSHALVQFGTSLGYETTGYSGGTGFFGSAGNNSSLFTSGLGIWSGLSTNALYGITKIKKISGSKMIAEFDGTAYDSTAQSPLKSFTNKTLSGTIDRIKITTSNGTDTFDGGSVTVICE